MKARTAAIGVLAMTMTAIAPLAAAEAEGSRDIIACGSVKTITVGDGAGKVEYRHCRKGDGPTRKVEGSVTDTDADGYCVTAKIVFHPWGPVREYEVCGDGDERSWDTGWQGDKLGYVTGHLT